MPDVSINIIRVAPELFTPADAIDINNAIAVLRSTYATVGITLRRVERFFIPLASARGRETIDNNGEAEALTDEWTVNNHNVDVFFVRNYVGTTAGLSPVNGPCDKNAKGMDGAVVEMSGSLTGLILAHEVGHYLGLSHVTGASSNLMFPTVPNGGLLTAAQGATMRSHCFIEP